MAGTCRCQGQVYEEIIVVAGWDQFEGTKHKKREKIHPCNVFDKAFKSLPSPTPVYKGCGKKFNPNNSINRKDKFVCGKPHHKSFCHFSMWGKDHHGGDSPQSEGERGGGEEEDGSGQLEEEDRHPLPF